MSDLMLENREITVTVTPKPDFTLFFDRMVGVEELGRPFRYEIDLVTTSLAKAKLGSMLGSTLAVKVERDAPGKFRYFHGMITRATYLGTRGRLESYRVEVRPRLWLLTHKVESRFFLNKTWIAVVKELLTENGISVEDKTTGAASLPVQEFIVQYRETTFDFISRLLEKAGVYYYHGHTASDHKLILADDSSGHSTLEDYAEIEYFDAELDSRYRRTQDHIFDWVTTASFTSGAFSQRDYNFTTPTANMEGKEVKAPEPVHPQSSLEVYDYPGDHANAGDGRKLAGIRMEEIATARQVADGEGNVRTLTCGGLFKLKEFGDSSQNIQHLIISATYNLTMDESTGADTTRDSFLVNFRAIPSTVRFRPRRLTPKPVIQGPQTAKVVGTAGEEIDTDQYGRVKVKFHWDRTPGNGNENSSCWVRVSQPWAGVGWGGILIPRIGQEVIVEFLEGDPDRPIITGRVYNADTKVPYALPANKTITTFMSRSSPGGSASTFNEIKFEDKKGAELHYQRAEKDMTIDVKHGNRRITIDEGHDDLEVKKGNRTVLISTGNYKMTVSTGNWDTIVSKGHHKTEVKMGNHNTEVSLGSQDTTISVGSRTVNVKVGSETKKISLGNKTTETTVGSQTLKAGKAIELTVANGASSIKMDATSITLSAGANSIKLDPGGITISGAPNVKASAAALAEISGALVKIN